MIFADKLMQLRKKSGWSQEELAEQMQVTRQSVSKWESAQSIPDLEKMLRLSDLFAVSLDYLLKDNVEEAVPPLPQEDASPVRRVSMEEASAFLDIKQGTARTIAIAVLLCVLSPICLLLLGAMSETGAYGLSDATAGGAGMIILLGMVAAAVAMFIASGAKTAPYAYLEKEDFETAYGVSSLVKQRQEQYKSTYTQGCIIGVCTCILALVPLFAAIMLAGADTFALVAALAGLLLLVGVGVMVLVCVGIVWASFETLLQEGDYTRERKASAPLRTGVSVAFWLIATAIYLAYSLATNRWASSWIIWVVAGVLYPALLAVIQGRKRP